MASLSRINYRRVRRGQPLRCACGSENDVQAMGGETFLCPGCRAQDAHGFDPHILMERRREDPNETI
jgi:hypothetical protein